MKWGIYDDYAIRNLKPSKGDSLLIRILEPAYKNSEIPYNIKYINNYKDVLELYFDDIRFHVSDDCQGRFVEFDVSMAKKLINFVQKNSFAEINVHCNKGSSRSSAIMYCVAIILDNKSIIEEIKKDNYYNPNELVLKVFKPN